ncbi:ParA family protein, partial [Vibrio parahaemolyticus]|nr:ParA family protein [Vibrio parahaemolyticus]
MKREKTIENLLELAEPTQQVQADRNEIVLQERSDNYYPPTSKPIMET